MTKFTLLLLSTLLSGCAYVQYTPYEGRSASPMSEGAFVDRSYALPIYKGLPPRPYTVLGFIEASERRMSFEGCYHAAVRAAKERGADAVLFFQKGQQYAGTVGGGSISSSTFYSGQASATPIGSSVYASGTGTANTFGSASTWTSPVWLEQAQYVAIKWK